MARMYSGKKGKARSYKPLERKVQPWVSYKPKEVEALIVKLAKAGMGVSQIGLQLRDVYGIPDVKAILEKGILEVVEEKNLLPEIPEDLMSLLKREVHLRKHLEKNHKDETARRGLILTQSKAKRLVKYYIKAGRLPENWKYDPARVALLVE